MTLQVDFKRKALNYLIDARRYKKDSCRRIEMAIKTLSLVVNRTAGDGSFQQSFFKRWSESIVENSELSRLDMVTKAISNLPRKNGHPYLNSKPICNFETEGFNGKWESSTIPSTGICLSCTKKVHDAIGFINSYFMKRCSDCPKVSKIGPTGEIFTKTVEFLADYYGVVQKLNIANRHRSTQGAIRLLKRDLKQGKPFSSFKLLPLAVDFQSFCSYSIFDDYDEAIKNPYSFRELESSIDFHGFS